MCYGNTKWGWNTNSFLPNGINRRSPGAFNLKAKQLNKQRKLIKKGRKLGGWTVF